jgi:hypothetical protein
VRQYWNQDYIKVVEKIKTPNCAELKTEVEIGVTKNLIDIMKRPECWTSLPHHIKEALTNKIWSQIDYDPYEGSRAEEIDKILNNYYDDYTFHANFKLMRDAYNELTDEELTTMVRGIINGLRIQADNLEKWL